MRSQHAGDLEADLRYRCMSLPIMIHGIAAVTENIIVDWPQMRKVLRIFDPVKKCQAMREETQTQAPLLFCSEG
jgi:hypothetical protein